ncbi:MAG TPA: ClpXP protease specificity-enhancing factor SspB, partial [Sphingomicrobium sp.]|nr:ClpXP protease specificity-enhancing factor SspB [Sphingomicrobium sp.]
RFPDEMTIVIQHRFWDLKVGDDQFSVGLSFGGVPSKLTVPFGAVTEFVDPAVDFSLKFQANAPEPPEDHDEPDNDSPDTEADDGSNVVSVDFTKKK